MCFDLFDTSGGREVVNTKVILPMLRSMGLNPLTNDCDKVMKDSDMVDKEIDFAMFCSIYIQFQQRPAIATMQDMNEAFKTMDREGQGMIYGGQLRNMLTIMGDKISDADYDTVVKKFETGEDHLIKFDNMVKEVLAS